MPEHYSRRDVLKATAGLASVGTLAGCSQASPVGGAKAAVDVQANRETITGSSSSGKVSEITVSLTGTAKWSNLPDHAERVRVRGTISYVDEDTGPTIGEDETTDLGSGSFDYAIEDADIAAETRGNPVLDKHVSDFSASEDGKTNVTDAKLTAHAEVWGHDDDDGKQSKLLSDSVSVPLTIKVTNEPGNKSPEVSVTTNVSGTVVME